MAGWGCRGVPVPSGGPHGAGCRQPWWLLLLAWLSLGCAGGTAQGPALGTPARVPEPPAPARPRRQPARGTWGPWGPWSSCSSSCGDGVALRTRRCLRSTEEEPCTGDPRQYRLCQLQGCPGGSVPFRAMQCSLYDNKPVLGTQARYRWVPFHGAPNVCDLNCLAMGHNFYYSFGRVLDGTRCSPGSPDLCVGGRCLVGSVGCDGILGSGTQPDACGQCGGGHDACLFVHRLFQGTDPSSGYFGYMNVTKIPAGATHIKVMDKSRNYLGRTCPVSVPVHPSWSCPDDKRWALRAQRGLVHRLAGTIRGGRHPAALHPDPRWHRDPGGARAHRRGSARDGPASGAQPWHRVRVLAAPRAPPARPCRHQPPAAAPAPGGRQPPAPGAPGHPGPCAADPAQGFCHGAAAKKPPRLDRGRGCRRAMREVPPTQGTFPAHLALLPE
ncbi:ADAMTS-like protein 5 isoform X3 [Aquila chrysaetos chrysaetos]|uniref:ADAMTS-like protein 5 isoform X3 n=1 Tax=Aquila chrysaetos chrysaetos TaxID=223781 RepID=UPI0011768441|nr:ADAMTS-like protein 5 isoform X3 [Aquila chrysaetos chrysaetos]